MLVIPRTTVSISALELPKLAMALADWPPIRWPSPATVTLWSARQVHPRLLGARARVSWSIRPRMTAQPLDTDLLAIVKIRPERLVVPHPVVVTTSGEAGAGRVPDGSLTDLLDRWTGPALSLARRIVVDERIAEDVVQKAFVAHWRNPDAFVPARGSFGSWFLSLAHHKAVDAVRREASLRRSSDGDVVDEASSGRSGADVAELVAEHMGDVRVGQALAQVPEVEREMLVLAYWGGLTQREIAVCTGAPLVTVKTRMLAGMRRLCPALG